MNSIKFKEYKNRKAKYIGIGLLLFSFFIMTQELSGIILTVIGLLILGVNTEIEVFENFDNKLNITLFNTKLFSIKKNLIYPEYISLFGQSFSSSNEFSTVSALGSTAEFDFYVIRLFGERNRNDVIFKSKNKDEVLIKGSELSILLDVELVNKLED
ncbi:MAG: hypothetical protein HRT69_17200 [Flavobacteriaceae bacterium]|nr:hypothetical protein [Flavobacteriaceae bacterium]